MSNVYSHGNVEVEFTEEEMETLKKAYEILKETENELWMGNDIEVDVSIYFTNATYPLKAIIEGRYD